MMKEYLVTVMQAMGLVIGTFLFAVVLLFVLLVVLPFYYVGAAVKRKIDER